MCKVVSRSTKVTNNDDPFVRGTETDGFWQKVGPRSRRLQTGSATSAGKPIRWVFTMAAMRAMSSPCEFGRGQQ